MWKWLLGPLLLGMATLVVPTEAEAQNFRRLTSPRDYYQRQYRQNDYTPWRYARPDYRHDRFHDRLEHREYHRDLEHRRAHRYPMTWWQHEDLHDRLDHDRYHDDLRHREYHRRRDRERLQIWPPGVYPWSR